MIKFEKVIEHKDLQTGDNRIPYPEPPGWAEALYGKLMRVLDRITYKEGWEFGVGQANRLQIKIECINSLNGSRYGIVPFYDRFSSFPVDHWDPRYPMDPPKFWVMHTFVTPPYVHNFSDEEAERWILDRIIDVEKHEAMEFFKVNGTAVYFPNHEPGGDPYVIERKS